jgi:carbonic anhydrase
VAITIKGFDQITATLGGIAISGALLATVWYGGKYLASQEAEREEAMVARAEKELKASAARQSPPHAGVDGGHHSARPDSTARPVETQEIWGYQGNLAPWYWGNLRSEFKNCAAKTNQSPIDISGSRLNESLKALKLNYFHGVTAMTFHHSTVQGQVERGSWLDWDGERFDLKDVRFRTPSEHRTNGLPWEMEVQLVHQSVSGAKINVAILMTPGAGHSFMKRLSDEMPTLKDEVKDIERLNWRDVFPAKRTYWSYIGSETIPPCEPDVRWIILTEPVHVPKSTIDRLVTSQKNNIRPVFPLGQRALHKSNR